MNSWVETGHHLVRCHSFSFMTLKGISFLSRGFSGQKTSIWLWINTYENTIFSGMNIHLPSWIPAILMWTEGFYQIFWTHPHIIVMLKPSTMISPWFFLSTKATISSLSFHPSRKSGISEPQSRASHFGRGSNHYKWWFNKDLMVI